MIERAAPRETIAAISTPAGEGAVALVRVSGEGALAVADRLFRGKTPPSEFVSHTQHFGELVSNEELIDEVLLSLHRAPNSYTGEDLVEISCHGGMLVTTKVLEACFRAGARAARPGEFSERAFLNGKLDLTQAEAVIDVIRAQSDLALRSATEQLSGRLGGRFRAIRSELIAILAEIEASLDFPEQGIQPQDNLTIRERLHVLRDEMAALLATADTGRVLREGLRVVIFGATNAGKSSLLNRLLGVDRAIVSDLHGTTRDPIEERVNLRGIPVRLLDTAGLRAPENAIEREGIARTHRALEVADLRLHIVDGSVPALADFVHSPDELLVINKSDLPLHANWTGLSGVCISCKTGAGLAELEHAVFERISGGKLASETPLAINARHRTHLRSAAAACGQADRAMAEGATPEMFAVGLHEALSAMDELLGGGDEEAVRNAVFSQFCIGK